MAPEGIYSHVTIDDERFTLLCLGRWPPFGTFAAVTLLDELFEDRVEMLTRFRAALQHHQTVRDPRLSALRRRTLREMLQAIDGRRAGATYQEVAQVLFRIAPARSIAWKSMSERDAVMRRVRDGVKLINGDYRKLLRHHRPR